MHLKAIHFKNFRRLKDTVLDLDSAISILVGSNNSGKTSASQALQLFLQPGRDAFSVHDFNVACWDEIDAFGNADDFNPLQLPTIQADLWFEVDAGTLHRVIALLPSLRWSGSKVGLRLEFGAIDPLAMRQRFKDARAEAEKHATKGVDGSIIYCPPPRTLMDYIKGNLSREFEVHAFVLDDAQFTDFKENEGYKPAPLVIDNDRNGRAVLSKLIKVDILNAQRHLSDSGDSARSEDLSNRLSRFYRRNLEQRGIDYAAIGSLAESERQFKAHLDRVFEDTLKSIETLGYPGLGHPRLLIEPDLNPEALLRASNGARVHYAVDGAAATLPDRYNGLGFKNLIYMVVELLDLHRQWLSEPESRPPIHLVFIEEPEAHLHAQLQQVFIRQVLKILAIDAATTPHAHSQVVVTTHSSHIVYERGFEAIRYFRRAGLGKDQSSQVLNLSQFKLPEPASRDFLVRYLKLTHCDLFFADAVILVEGNVERLLMPLMVELEAPRLATAHLSILEIGGAFAHKFETLINFLGLKCLVVTDIDSVAGKKTAKGQNSSPANIDDEQGTSCSPDEPLAVTSNPTLKSWLPKLENIAELATAPVDKCTSVDLVTGAHVRVCYQKPVAISQGTQTVMVSPRTFEDAFALQNQTWCQHKDQGDLRLRVAKGDCLAPAELAAAVSAKIRSGSFKKTAFAVALLTREKGAWKTPTYIAEGLRWLELTAAPVDVANGITVDPIVAVIVP